METWDAVCARRNVRSYAERSIPVTDLDRILEAAWRAPSGSNRQLWGFVLVTDREQLQELATVWGGAAQVATSAATVALVVPTDDEFISSQDPGVRPILERTRQYDLGQATIQMMIVAADMGIGSAHSAVGDQKKARSVLGFPEDYECHYLIAFGYPADRPLAPIRKPDRRPMGEIIHRGYW